MSQDLSPKHTPAVAADNGLDTNLKPGRKPKPEPAPEVDNTLKAMNFHSQKAQTQTSAAETKLAEELKRVREKSAANGGPQIEEEIEQPPTILDKIMNFIADALKSLDISIFRRKSKIKEQEILDEMMEEQTTNYQSMWQNKKKKKGPGEKEEEEEKTDNYQSMWKK